MRFFNFGRKNTAKLLATGQLTSYGSGTGVDDGALKKGVVKRYTILTTGQYSGTTNITINGKTDVHSNNCVFDDNTGLMWSRYVSASVGPASDGKLPWTTTGAGTTAEGIFAYAAAANVASLAGYTDWYVPDDNQLKSLADMETPSGAPDSVAFPSYPGSTNYIHASTTEPDNPVTSSMHYRATNGFIAGGLKTTAYYCHLVRG
jgi:hypothetical protein